jgi:hypothetical protein
VIYGEHAEEEAVSGGSLQPSAAEVVVPDGLLRLSAAEAVPDGPQPFVAEVAAAAHDKPVSAAAFCDNDEFHTR